jgi:aspartate kinase
MIIQSQRSRLVNDIPSRDIAFTVSQADIELTEKTLNELLPEIGAQDILLDKEIAKVSLVGAGMVGNPGVAAKMFSSLSEEKINIQMITTSEIKISCVVSKSQGKTALQVIHRVFNLGNQ